MAPHLHSRCAQIRNKDRMKIYTQISLCAVSYTKKRTSESALHAKTWAHTFRKILFRYKTSTGTKHTAVTSTDHEKAAHPGSGIRAQT